jgi:hypothetical protein
MSREISARTAMQPNGRSDRAGLEAIEQRECGVMSMV